MRDGVVVLEERAGLRELLHVGKRFGDGLVGVLQNHEEDVLRLRDRRPWCDCTPARRRMEGGCRCDGEKHCYNECFCMVAHMSAGTHCPRQQAVLVVTAR